MRNRRAAGVDRGAQHAGLQRREQPGGRTRIVILVALSSRLTGGYFGMLTQGFPQLVRLNPDVVKPDPARTFPERSPVLCSLRMVNEAPLVPDLEHIEGMIADETSVAA